MTIEILRLLSDERMADARALFLTAGRNEGAIHLCGYAVEFGIESADMRNSELEQAIPETGTGKRPRLSNSLRTHDLEVLLRTLSGSLRAGSAAGLEEDTWRTGC